jgi:hypothetical protein
MAESLGWHLPGEADYRKTTKSLVRTGPLRHVLCQTIKGNLEIRETAPGHFESRCLCEDEVARRRRDNPDAD